MRKDDQAWSKFCLRWVLVVGKDYLNWNELKSNFFPARKCHFLCWYGLIVTIPLHKEEYASILWKGGEMNSDKFQTCPNCREIQVSTLALNCPKCGAPQDPATVSQKGKSYQKREWGSLENYIPCAACGAQRPDRHYHLETVCPNCGDKRLSNSAYYGRFLLIIPLLGVCLWGISRF